MLFMKSQLIIMDNKRDSQTDVGYEVLEDYDVSIGKKLAPHIKQQFESIKK